MKTENYCQAISYCDGRAINFFCTNLKQKTIEGSRQCSCYRIGKPKVKALFIAFFLLINFAFAQKTDFINLYHAQIGGAKVALVKQKNHRFLRVAFTEPLAFSISTTDTLQLTFADSNVLRLAPAYSVSSESITSGSSTLYWAIVDYKLTADQLADIQFCILRAVLQPVHNGYIRHRITKKKGEALQDLVEKLTF